MTWSGVKYQISKDRRVRAIPGKDLELVESSIIQILNTVPGERVHLPDFGSRLKLLVFSTLDEFLAIQIKTEIKDAINRWEDRVSVIDVEVSIPEDNPEMTDQETISATIRYVFKFGLKGVKEFRISF